jgi:hypothetical protein
MKKSIKVLIFILLICGFLFASASPLPQYSNHSNPSYEFRPQSNTAQPVIFSSDNRYDNNFFRYCPVDISIAASIGKVFLKLPGYSDNDSIRNNPRPKSLFCQNCLLQI